MRALRRLLSCVLLVAASRVPMMVVQSASAATIDCHGTVLKSNGTPWTCTFDDEFDGTVLDSHKWSPVTSALSGLAYGGGCFTNWPDNISVSGGYLHLTALKRSAPFNCLTKAGVISTPYATGQVASLNHFAQMYGLFRVRAKFPATTVAGLQSSLWMWPQDLASTTELHGEIDIAEEFSYNANYVTPFLHYLYDPRTVNTKTHTNVVTSTCAIGDRTAFHTYGAQWTHSTITITIDNKVCLIDNLKPSGTSPFDQPFFMALSQALGSTRPNPFTSATPLPATTFIDWVRAWK